MVGDLPAYPVCPGPTLIATPNFINLLIGTTETAHTGRRKWQFRLFVPLNPLLIDEVLELLHTPIRYVVLVLLQTGFQFEIVESVNLKIL